MPALTKEHYNLAVWERDEDAMQVFVAGRAQIDMIEYIKDASGDEFWTKTDGIFVMDVEPATVAPHEIFLGKSDDYLTFKLTSEPKIYTMGICDFGSIFNVETFDCTPCPVAKKSFGIQAQEC